MIFHTNKPDRQEPFWTAAKQDGQCAQCAGDIIQGERIVFHRQVWMLISAGMSCAAKSNA
ncbi:MAG TPA: hypothetical protein VFK06_09010 [Candidatus Angelobacter sp.]|nr:hypothetical protein [Candidatus Angelobacter sp.]